MISKRGWLANRSGSKGNYSYCSGYNLLWPGYLWKKNLPELIRKILENKDFQWLRLLYSYPESFPLELLDLMKEDKRICPYLDLPIQHSSNRIRKLMNRRGSRKDLLNLIKEIRTAIPDVVIRTSLIVGFPGEEEEDFEDLLDFIQEVKFDRLGVLNILEKKIQQLQNLIFKFLQK